MSLASGTKLGRYEIRSHLGAGGMGEVYLARDPKINRDVAIKVLPAAFSSDAERLRWFEQEVQATGKLNHPNILAVHDVETHDGAPYVVYELLEGKTLRERLSGGALSARKAVDFALQISQGLTAAHEKGIVHRDLKPENIFITNDGRIKILDFGLAKLREPTHVEEQTDVLTRRVNTDPGAVMGTVGYMSPEQVRAQRVDHRSDIFSLGLILYEMLSGKRAFRGDSAVETLNAILKEDPVELSESNSQINPALERVVMHCLEKSPAHRFQSASDVAFALEALSGLSSSRTLTEALPLTAPRLKNRERLAWIVAGVFLLGLLAALPFAIAYLRRAPADERVIKLSLLPPEETTMTGIVTAVAVSPDGRRLALVASTKGSNRLWIRSLDSLTAQLLPGTEGASAAGAPFWSPDSRFIGFAAGGKLKRIEASGGPPQTLCDASAARGGTWNRDGVIVFATGLSGVLYRVPATGGEPIPVTKLDQSRSETAHRWPYFLPDGQRFLYFVRSSQTESGGIFVGSLDGKEPKRLLPGVISAVYGAPGFLLFLRDGTLMAQRFDVDKLQLTGDAFPIAEHVAYNIGLGRGAFSVSENGVLAYTSGSSEINQPLWFDRAGKQLGSVGTAGLYFTVWLSPDENRAAVNRVDTQTGTNDVWLFDLQRGVPSRFTTDPASDSNPLWSPDGSRIVFASNREGISNLYQKMASGGGNEEVLLRSDEEKWPNDWSLDGRFIIYQSFSAKTKWDLWVLPITGDRQVAPFLQTEFNEQQAQFSPDGKWLAYVSDESGAPEVYIRTFPDSGAKWRVSTGGGSQPKWRRDSRELFYIAPDRQLMAVDIKLGATFEAGVPKSLFVTRVLPGEGLRNQYTATADGQRFLVNSTFEDADATPISVVVNWTAALKR